MLIVVSPAKTLDFTQTTVPAKVTMPDFLADSKKLIKQLRAYTQAEIAKLMGLSSKLAELNYNRYHE